MTRAVRWCPQRWRGQAETSAAGCANCGPDGRTSSPRRGLLTLTNGTEPQTGPDPCQRMDDRYQRLMPPWSSRLGILAGKRGELNRMRMAGFHPVPKFCQHSPRIRAHPPAQHRPQQAGSRPQRQGRMNPDRARSAWSLVHRPAADGAHDESLASGSKSTRRSLITPSAIGPNPAIWQVRIWPTPGWPSMTDSVMADAHSPICPKCSPTTAQASSAGALTTRSTRNSMQRSSPTGGTGAIPK